MFPKSVLIEQQMLKQDIIAGDVLFCDQLRTLRSGLYFLAVAAIDVLRSYFFNIDVLRSYFFNLLV